MSFWGVLNLSRIHIGVVVTVAMVLLLQTSPIVAAEVIVNSSVSESVEQRDLRFIFTMKRRRWEDGSAITVFVLPAANEIHKQFCKEKLGIYPHQLEAVWYRLVYSGMGKAPIEVLSKEKMLEMVAATPGAIGYVDSYVDSEGNDASKHIINLH